MAVIGRRPEIPSLVLPLMNVRPFPVDESLVIVRPEERPWGFLAHAMGCIPIWGFVFNIGLWMFFRHRSREMIFHIQQVIQFHIILLLPIFAWNLLGVIGLVLAQLSPSLAAGLGVACNFLLICFLTLTTAVALIGGGLVYVGRPFFYPGIGRRVLAGSINKLMEE